MSKRESIQRRVDRIVVLKEYVQSCIIMDDWHGVWDAAMEIEALKSVIKALNES